MANILGQFSEQNERCAGAELLRLTEQEEQRGTAPNRLNQKAGVGSRLPISAGGVAIGNSTGWEGTACSGMGSAPDAATAGCEDIEYVGCRLLRGTGVPSCTGAPGRPADGLGA
jgi:hypothetical protein